MTALVRRNERVIGAGDDQCRRDDTVYGGAQVTGRKGFATARISFGRHARKSTGELLEHLWMLLAEAGREPPRNDAGSNRGDAISANACGALDIPLGRLQPRERAHHHEAANALAVVRREPHSDHAAERHPAERHGLHAEGVEQRDHIGSQILDGVWTWRRRRSAETAVVVQEQGEFSTESLL